MFVCLGLRSGSVAVGSCLKALWKGSARGCAPCCRLPALCSTAMHILWVCCRHPLCHTLTEADLHLLVPCHRGGGAQGLRWTLPYLLGCFLCFPPCLTISAAGGEARPGAHSLRWVSLDTVGRFTHFPITSSISAGGEDQGFKVTKLMKRSGTGTGGVRGHCSACCYHAADWDGGPWQPPIECVPCCPAQRTGSCIGASTCVLSSM